MQQNWQQLRVMTLIYLAGLVLYYSAVSLLDPVPAQSRALLIAIAAQTAYSLAVELRREPPRSMLAENAVLMTFAAMIMALAIYLGTVVFRQNIAWMFLIEIIMLTQFYTMRPLLKTMELTVYFLIFALCSCRFKSSAFAVLDLVSGMFALCVALTSYYSLLVYKIEAFENKAELRRMCSVDAMTGLLNKTTFEHFYTQFLKQAPLKSYALAILDLNDFKSVNDRCGHMAGDEIIRIVADCLRSTFLDSYEIGRFGGDEFVVLAEKAERKGTEEKFETLMRHISETSMLQAKVPVTVSIGIVFSEQEAVPFTRMFIAADNALYEAKKKKGNNVCIAESTTLNERTPAIAVMDLSERDYVFVHDVCGRQYELMPLDSSVNAVKQLEKDSSCLLLLIRLRPETCRKNDLLEEIRLLRQRCRMPVVLLCGNETVPPEWSASADAVLREPVSAAELALAVGPLLSAFERSE